MLVARLRTPSILDTHGTRNYMFLLFVASHSSLMFVIFYVLFSKLVLFQCLRLLLSMCICMAFFASTCKLVFEIDLKLSPVPSCRVSD